MKKILKSALRNGLIGGVILVFFELINFTSTLSTMLGKLFNKGADPKAGNPGYLCAVVGLILFFCGVAFARKFRREESYTLVPFLIGAVLLGFAAGCMISALNIILGTFLNNGVDVRGYLDALSPDVIKNSLFNTTIKGAVSLYFMTCIVASLLGTFISFITVKTKQPGTLIKKFAAWTEELHVREFFTRNRAAHIILVLLVIAILLIIPAKLSPYLVSIIAIMGIYAIMGLGLNIIVGLSGQLVFGYVAFYALGAYTMALLTAPKPFGIGMNFWLAMFFAIVIAGIGGVLIGVPTMNLRGDYLAIVTLGFAEIVRILINSNLLADLTGGPQGVKDIGQPAQPAIIGKILGKPLEHNIWFLYLILALFFVVLFFVRNLQYSRTGRSWEAMREDETVAQACGVATNHYKLLAVVIGAAIAGVAGALYASRNTYTGPAEYAFMVSVNALAVIVVGGMGSIPGTVLGSFVIKGLPEMLRDLESYRMLVFGALLIIMMVIRPEGLLPVKRRKLAVEPESVDVLKEDLIHE